MTYFLHLKTSKRRKKAFGQALNKLKIKAQEKVDALQKHFGDKENLGNSKIDLTMSAEPYARNSTPFVYCQKRYY